MKNIEIKFQTSSLEEVSKLLKANMEIQFKWKRLQEDIYYNISSGRLKLRSETKSPAQLIYYRRTDSTESRESEYEIYYLEDPDKMKTILGAALGIKVIVQKVRSLFSYRNVRIHLDQVSNLGDFVELESVIDAHTPELLAQKRLDQVLSYLQPLPLIPIAKSYSDLLMEK
ncbi:MAG: class IV adenylate cyclase [Calditrichia bacterium]